MKFNLKEIIFKVIIFLTSSKPILGQQSLENSNNSEFQFIALEYCYLIWNRVIVVNFINDFLCAAKISGPIMSPQVLSESHKLPSFYVKHKILDMSKVIFKVSLNEIHNIEFNTIPKWGMGKVPYSGRVKVILKNGQNKDFILLGQQDGKGIVNFMRSKIGRPLL